MELYHKLYGIQERWLIKMCSDAYDVLMDDPSDETGELSFDEPENIFDPELLDSEEIDA